MTRYTDTRATAFNRDCEFTVLRPLRISGKDCKPGDVVDKTLLTTRRLRQLYESRHLSQGLAPHQGLNLPEEIDFGQLPTAAILAWLSARKKSPRPGSNRTKIISYAKMVQEKEKAAEKKESPDAVVPGEATKGPDLQGVQRKAPKGNGKAADA